MRITVKISGDGSISDFELDPEQHGNVEGCITIALLMARFPQFSGESMSVVWPVRW